MDEFKFEINYPERTAEFEIQAELYTAIKELGFDVRGEVKAYRSMFDLVVFKLYKPKCIIEVKSSKNIIRSRERLSKSGQHRKYSMFNLPLVYCYSKQEIPRCLDIIKKIMVDSEYAASFTELDRPRYVKQKFCDDSEIDMRTIYDDLNS